MRVPALRLALLPLATLPAATAVGQQCQEGRLQASDAGPTDLFGSTLAVSGEPVAVGAPGAAPNGLDSGAVYVFERGMPGWVETAKLTPGGAGADDRFGGAVALSGDRIAVGAVGYDAQTLGGTVFVFARVGGVWQQEDQPRGRRVPAARGMMVS